MLGIPPPTAGASPPIASSSSSSDEESDCCGLGGAVVAGDAGTEPCPAAGWAPSATPSPFRCWRMLRTALTPLPELSARDARQGVNTPCGIVAVMPPLPGGIGAWHPIKHDNHAADLRDVTSCLRARVPHNRGCDLAQPLQC